MTAFDIESFRKATWLREPPEISVLGAASFSEFTLHVERLTCERKNELSNDEIGLLGFWSTRDGDPSGPILQGFAFSTAGQSQDPKLSIGLANFASDQILFLLLFEEDEPPIDPHDMLGLIAVFPNLSINVFVGDIGMRSRPEAAKVIPGKPTTVQFDAGSKGQYSTAIRIDK